MANWRMGQDLNYDLLNYHVYGAYSLLSGRLFGSVDIPGHFITNPLPWVPYLVLTRLLQPVAGTSVIAGVQAINLPLTIAVMGALIGDPWPRLPNFGATIGTAVLVAAAPVSRSLVGTSFAELTYAPLVLGGCLLLLHAGGPSSNSCRTPRIVWAGLLLGSAFGLKLTAGPYSLAGAAAIAVGWEGWRPRLTALFWLVIGGAAGAAATGGWWAIFTWWRYGSPVYPFFNAIFRSRFAPAVNWRDTQYLPRSATDVLLLPWRWATGSFPSVLSFHGLHVLLVVLLALISLVAMVWHRARGSNQIMPSVPTRRFAAFMATGGAAWLSVFAIERYAVPLELLTAPAIVAMVWRFVGGRLRLAVLVVLVTPALVWSRAPAFGRIPWGKSWFGVTLPPELRDQPATYVGMGPKSGSKALSVSDSWGFRPDWIPCAVLSARLPVRRTCARKLGRPGLGTRTARCTFRAVAAHDVLRLPFGQPASKAGTVRADARHTVLGGPQLYRADDRLQFTARQRGPRCRSCVCLR